MTEQQIQVVIAGLLGLGQVILVIIGLQTRAARMESRTHMVESVMGLRGEMAQHTTSIALLSQRVDTLAHQQQRTGERVDEVSRRVHDLSNAVTGMRSSVVELQRDIERLDQTDSRTPHA